MRPYERWLNQAWDDLQFARLGLEQGFHAQACFLSQQVIEKCLKGCLRST
ncbi:HEPN domain-containing protein [Candidatus Methylomirabilis limnetica]